jgi:CubicO group peptidase (beta-lactamase class C family)
MIGAVVVSAFLPLLACLACAQDYFPPPDNRGGWRTLTDPSQIERLTGIDVKRLDQAFEYTQRTTKHGGLLVVRHGYLVYEKYFGRGNRDANPDNYSVTKAVTSMAVGIMLSEKREQIPEGLDTKIFSRRYLPEAFPLTDPRKAKITLGQVLAFTSGIQDWPVVYPPGTPSPQHNLEEVYKTDSSDENALHLPLWGDPGSGWRYSTLATHLAGLMVRKLTGMELEDYVRERLAKPMGWGQWGFVRHLSNGETLPHTPGGAGLALRPTDALRFAYLLLHQGRWADRQLIPADYVEKATHPSPYNPYTPYSLQLEINADGHVAGAPRDAFYKSGAGGYAVYAVPSLDMSIYKMGGSDLAYDPSRTGLPLLYQYDGSRETWQPHPADVFWDGPIDTDVGIRRVLEMVVASVMTCPP